MISVPVWWNYLLASLDVVGLAALVLVGKKVASGWLWAMLTQAVTIIYAATTLQWGFLAVAVVKLVIYTRNWVLWLRGDKKKAKEGQKELIDFGLEVFRYCAPEGDPEAQRIRVQRLLDARARLDPQKEPA